MKSGIQVGDAMTINLVSVGPDMNLVKCSKIMSGNNVGAVIVKDDGATLGILTEKDIVRKAVALGVNVTRKKVGEFMETKLITINPNADIYDALIKMRDNNIRRLPVVQNDELVGLLTVKDVLKIEPQLFDIMVEKFELKEESRKLINTVVPTEGICQSCGAYSKSVKDVKGSTVCGRCAKEQLMVA
jgi:CBS domain-containing protein|tara:strand:+ start:1302 stop:1862 length:561 start_codon:yes stop_codon:yes gene_type:complete